jgi:subtilisin family serine protease
LKISSFLNGITFPLLPFQSIGTVGGKTVGIAKCANIYGVKVLSDAGSGSTSTILAGMDAALSRHQAKGTAAKSVVSMSLGGSCGTSCSTNAMILKVQEMTAAGMIVSVAAGNSAADSGAYTPAAAPDALTVGASSIRDSMASFSNYGTLIDIMGPGVDITSVCSSRATCSGLWWTISGTSMACPHVSGVAAQLLEKGAHVEMTSLAAVNELRNSMLDDSSKGQIIRTPRGTITDLLQVPKDDGIWNGETVAPTTVPTGPTLIPTANPTENPTTNPTADPSEAPSAAPSGPSEAPSAAPSMAPIERASVLVLMDGRVVDTTREGPNTVTDA